MKINKSGRVRPPKFEDTTLNGEFGKIVGKLSDDDVQAIIFRHTEVTVAVRVRQLWLQQLYYSSAALQPNQTWVHAVTTTSSYSSVAEEFHQFLRADSEYVAREQLLAQLHAMLADRVISALTDDASRRQPATLYATAVARDSSPLRHLDSSVDAFIRADRRLGSSNDKWSDAVQLFRAEAVRRNTFATTDRSLTLAKIDVSTWQQFEAWIAWLLERDGCTIIRRRGGARDHGADVIAVTPCGRRIVVQCKHSTRLRANRVEPGAVYQLNGTAVPEHGADIVGIVTNRTLSDDAQRFAVKHGINVIDRSALQQWSTYGVMWFPGTRIDDITNRQAA